MYLNRKIPKWLSFYRTVNLTVYILHFLSQDFVNLNTLSTSVLYSLYTGGPSYVFLLFPWPLSYSHHGRLPTSVGPLNPRTHDPPLSNCPFCTLHNTSDHTRPLMRSGQPCISVNRLTVTSLSTYIIYTTFLLPLLKEPPSNTTINCIKRRFPQFYKMDLPPKIQSRYVIKIRHKISHSMYTLKF